eukprot:Nk52_evm9s2241 gene=Nk52_evmTU9s2241
MPIKDEMDLEVQFSDDVKRQRQNRLQFLLQKTSVYSQFLHQKLERQQEQMKAREQKTAKRIEAKEKLQKERQEAFENNARETRLSKKGDGQAKEVSSVKTNSKNATKKKKRNCEEGLMDTYEEAKKQRLMVKEEEEEEETKEQEGPSARQPELITGGILREYQLKGLEWLVSLYDNGLNGILGDEMGLGKTLQTISLVAYLVGKGVKGPYLIVGPLSTLSNWVNEFNKFAPAIPTLLYHGTKEERADKRKEMKYISESNCFPVVITSYEIVMNDRKFLHDMMWKYIVVDEGHRIKNLNCKLIRELKSYDSANRLLLTGTPLQNNLSELWSLLNFLLPDIFDDLESFQEWFDFSEVHESEGHNKLIEKEEKNEIVTKLHRILHPFLLRRLKTDVEKYLPKKKEIVVFCPFTPLQQEYYTAILKKNIHNLITKDKNNDEVGVDDEEKKSGSRRNLSEIVSYKEECDRTYFKSLSDSPHTDSSSNYTSKKPQAVFQEKSVVNVSFRNILMDLRKCCNHPYLLDYPLDACGDYLMNEELCKCSGKLLILDRMLPALKERGHKVLIFSQMTKMLDILQDYFYLKKINYCRLDGSTSQEDRQQQIEEFNTDKDMFIFLLSTRAGGLGINLVSADTCIIYDSDWNPQVDLQAQDRCHRIGQTKPVIVYRFCTVNSIETKILERANAKRRLEKLVVHKGKFKDPTQKHQALTSSDLMELLTKEDADKFLGSVSHKTHGDIISDHDLEKILDRSFEKTEGVKEEGEEGSSAFKVIDESEQETTANGLLGTVM